MSALRRFLARVRGLMRGRQLDQDLRQQIESHLEEAAEEYARQGLSPADARRAALTQFGGVVQAEEAHRDLRSFAGFDHVRRDLGYAVRGLGRSRAFTGAVLIVLAVGTAAVTSVFALLDHVVLRPLPFPESDRLVVVRHAAPGLGLKDVGISSGLYFHYAAHARSFESMAVYKAGSAENVRLAGSGTERVEVSYASAALFKVLRVNPELGRLFTEEDGQPGFLDMNWTVPVLLAHDFWIRRFGGDPAVVGQTLSLNNRSRLVIGVLPRDFSFSRPDTQVWMLLEPPRETANLARDFGFDVVGRLGAGVTAARAQAELAELLPGVVGAYPDATAERLAALGLAPSVRPLKAAVIGDVSATIWTLFGGMILLLLVACANAGGLFLVRAEHRAREVGVRRALGADAADLARLFFTEALVVSAAAAALGLLGARWVLSTIIALAPSGLPRAAEIKIDGLPVAFAAGLALLMAGFYCLIAIRRTDRALSGSPEGGRTSTTPRAQLGRWGTDVLIALQVALALSLMAGSALMVQTYRNLSRSELGFSSDNILTAQINLPSRKYRQHVSIYQMLADRVRQLPGVRNASVASFLPLTPSPDIYPVEAGSTPILFKFFLPGYFQTMGTAILEGESFAAAGVVLESNPVLISQTLARRLYPHARAIGQPIRRLGKDGGPVNMGGTEVPPFTIAGIVADVRETAPRDGPAEIVYIPIADPPVERSIVPTEVTLVVRTSVPPLSLGAAVRRAIADVDPELSLGMVQGMDAIVRAARAREAFVGVLLLGAAIVSLCLGVAGVYGSVVQVVRRRTREIAVRMALGARRPEVVRMVVSGSMRAVLAGAALGLGVAFVAAQALSSLLFGVDAHDPVVFATVAAGLLSAASVSALLAALHAARISPVVALREE